MSGAEQFGLILGVFIVSNLVVQYRSARKLTQIQTTTQKTNRLVNGALAAQMKLTAMALRRVADMTGEEGDAVLAKAAEDALAAHLTELCEDE